MREETNWLMPSSQSTIPDITIPSAASAPALASVSTSRRGKTENVDGRFNRLVTAMRIARASRPELIQLSRVYGPPKVCSHLVDSVNENDGTSGDDAALIISFNGRLHVVHGVCRLLLARRRNARTLLVQRVAQVSGDDVHLHYALLVLAAQVTSNATVPAAFLAYVWGREGDSFLPTYVRLSGQPFVSAGVQRRTPSPLASRSWKTVRTGESAPIYIHDVVLHRRLSDQNRPPMRIMRAMLPPRPQFLAQKARVSATIDLLDNNYNSCSTRLQHTSKQTARLKRQNTPHSLRDSPVEPKSGWQQNSVNFLALLEQKKKKRSGLNARAQSNSFHYRVVHHLTHKSNASGKWNGMRAECN